MTLLPWNERIRGVMLLVKERRQISDGFELFSHCYCFTTTAFAPREPLAFSEIPSYLSWVDDRAVIRILAVSACVNIDFAHPLAGQTHVLL